MELILLKSRLIEGLGSVEKSIGGGDKLPILKSVKIEADEKSKIKISSTNLEVAVEKKLSGKVVDKGSIVIPFSAFNSIVRNLNSDKINLIKKDNKVEIKADNYEATVNCEDPEEFPVIPTLKNKSRSIEINGKVLDHALNQVITATKFSEIRPEINGVYLKKDKQNLTLAGTDSFRLLEKVLNKDNIDSSLDDLEVIVPLDTVKILMKNINKDSDVEIFSDPNQILFETDDLSIISRLVDGEYPDYKSVIPKETKKDIEVNREELINAINATKVFSGKANDIIFSLGDKNKILEVSSADNKLGESNHRVPIKIKGNKGEFSISFNWKYVLDGLKVFNSKKITLGVNNPDKPVLIKGDEPSTSYVVMPIRG